LLAEVDQGDVALNYDVGVVIALCQQRAAAIEVRRPVASPLVGRLSHGSIAGGLTGPTGHESSGSSASGPQNFVDLYANQPGGLCHLLIGREVKGLEALRAGESGGPLGHFLAECESRFAGALVDRRMVDMRVRQRPMVGAGSEESRRRGFSYASKGLNQLLEAIAPSLRDLSQAELASRLVYLTRHSTPGSS
jgi:hypothetical protein